MALAGFAVILDGFGHFILPLPSSLLLPTLIPHPLWRPGFPFRLPWRDRGDRQQTSLLSAEYRYNSLLVFSTGTQPISYKKLRKRRPLPTPDITILSLGTEIFYGESMVPDDDWEHYLNRKWDRDVVIEETAKFPQLSLQVDVKFVYGGGFWFDVIPSSAGKGEALVYLQKKFKSEGKLPINTLVCGDSGNDVEMFRVPDVYGVVVSNAHEELPQWYAQNCKDHPKIVHATERCADGIIQAIAHFKLGFFRSPRDAMDFSGLELGSSDPVHEVVMFYLLYERWRRAEVENSDSIILQNMKSITVRVAISNLKFTVMEIDRNVSLLLLLFFFFFFFF
ncbi:hypothetical protein BHM03_00030959 [Ensete ventricosum]|nr:hypothetical protein BHM03_00030959 [Ensete ventricosum]